MRCRFVNKIFQSEENGFTVAVYSTHDESVPLSARNKYLESRNIIGFTAVGYNLPLTNTIELEMEGDWENGSHGLQLKVDSFMEIVPRTKAGIIGYLSSGAIKGVKQRTAEAIYQQFGLQTLDVIEKSPEKLLSIRGISERKLREIVESYGQNQVFRELMTFLAPYKVTPKKVNMILKTFHEESVRIIQSRPYMLCAVKGFGFLTVDAIGRQLCRALNDPMRISGCISYILHEAMKEGHLFLNQETLMEDLKETTWNTWQYPEEGERTIYFLDLYGGERSDYGKYDGEACFAWLYDGDEEYQEYYEGWWSLEEVDGQVCLRLDICRIGGVMYQEGEEPQVISDQFPVLCDMEGLSLILHKGIQNGELLPFLNEQTDFEFMTKSVG